jgi:hypothetical protein
VQQLESYEAIFAEGCEHYDLASVERRWAWLKRLIKTVETKFANICPPHWRLLHTIVCEFCARTRSHLKGILQQGSGRDEDSDVSVLLKALQTSIRFEEEMIGRFEMDNSDGNVVPVLIGAGAETKPEQGENTSADAVQLPPITGSISSIFDQFLGPYILLERTNLDEMITRVTGEEEDALFLRANRDADAEDELSASANARTASGDIGVFKSSTNMFVFIKSSIKRCTVLSTGDTFLALSKEFKTCLKAYADWLKSKLPVPLTVSGAASNPVFKLPAGSDSLVIVSEVVNTCEYCAETVPTLEGMIRAKIREDLAAKVEMESELADLFLDLSAYSIKALVSSVCDRLEPAFKALNSTSWGSMQQVGEESAYVHRMHDVLVETVPPVRDSMSAVYFKNFCSKLGTEILQRYLDCIFKQKRISEPGTQQLLLDTLSVKALVQQLHHIGGLGAEGTIPPMYTRLVAQRVMHIECVLKLIATPEEMLVERFQIMWPSGTAQDMQNIMAMKGTRKHVQLTLLEAFNTTTAGTPAASSANNKTEAPAPATATAPAPSGSNLSSMRFPSGSDFAAGAANAASSLSGFFDGKTKAK